MKTRQAIAHFGTARELAKALGITPGAVSQWGEDVPVLREYQIRDLVREGRGRDAPGEGLPARSAL